MELKEQKFGIEIEMTGITRAKAAEVTAEYFGTRVKYLGTYYDTYAAIDTEGRQWKFMSDGSITAQKKSNGRKINAGREYQTEMVSPICRYEDIVTIQEIIRKLKEHGALTNGSCGIHVHINAEPFDARTLRNITNIMAAKEDLIYKALGVSVDRQHRWCQPVDTRFLEELNRRKPKSMEAVERIWYNGESRRDQHYDDSRYHCLNLHSVFQKGTVEFRLFNGTLHAGKIKAYIQFCLAIGAQALNQSCASRRKTQTSNEKYTFRTWLLRLGLNGEEFATARQHLLANLPGCIAWKDPAQAEAQKERMRQKREKELAEALKFYMGYLLAGKAENYFLQSLASVLTGTVQDSENRLARMDFKIAVELSKLSQVIAYTHDVDEESLNRLHVKCVDEVRRINGTVKFEDAYHYQKRDV